MKDKKILEDILLDIVFQIEKKEDLFDDPSIENGKMGIALFYFFCHNFFKDEYYIKKGENMIEDSIKISSNTSQLKKNIPKYRGDSLSNVLSSFGKGLLFVQYKFNYGYDFTEYYQHLSETLIDLNYTNFKIRDFDFFSGALSVGHFFLNKYYYERDELSKKALIEICDALSKHAVYYTNEEVFWEAPTYANQVYLGISHGSAMIINFYTKLFELKIIENKKCREKLLLQYAVNFVINRKRDLIDGYFPNKFSTKTNKEKTQFALCYGDLGVLFALYNANKILENKAFQKELNSMFTTSLNRKKDLEYTYDAGIFYGASGIYCVFRELYKRTKKVEFKEAMNYWYNQIISYRDAEQSELVGFIDFFKNVKNENNKGVKFSYGWGIAGIGICLMSGSDTCLPSINETLLIGI